jgi:hypothetical protein
MIKQNKLYEPCLGRFRKPTTTLNQSEIVRKKMVVPESQPKYPGNSENNQKESQYGEQSFDSKLLDQNRVEKPEFDLSSKVIQKKRREESNPLDLSRNREENPRFGSSGKKAVLRELTNQITKKAVLPIKNNLKHTTKDGSYKPYGNEPRISKQESMDSRRKDVFAELENSFEEIPLSKKPVVRSSLEQLESQASSPRTKKIIQNISSLKNATNPGSLAAHVSDNEEVVLSAEEEKTYGKRFPASYEKLKLIGKGGQAAVWLGSRKSDQQVFAIKQISLTGFVNEKTALKEIELNDIIFKNGSDELLYKLGCRSIIEVVEHFVTSKDIFIVLTLCGDSLSKLIYSIKGEFFKLERIYKVLSTYNR